MWSLPAILIMIVIFWFSCGRADESAKESGKVSYVIIRAVNSVFNMGWDDETVEEKAQSIDHYVRKTAHFMEYAFLALAFYLALSRGFMLMPKIRYPLSAGLTFLYAASDEIHQYFVDGRGSRFSDVLLDTAGGITMLLLIFGISTLINKRKRKKESNV